MCGARLFAVRVILLQRYKVLPACLPDFGSLPTLIQGARNGRQRKPLALGAAVEEEKSGPLKKRQNSALSQCECLAN